VACVCSKPTQCSGDINDEGKQQTGTMRQKKIVAVGSNVGEHSAQTTKLENLIKQEIEYTYTELVTAHGTYKDGKQNRRERRNKERKSKKK